MAKTPQQGEGSPHSDLLAAVVLHILVAEGREGMTVSSVAKGCERNPSDEADMNEVECALQILLRDGLARYGEERFAPTRAAIRASELSF